MPRTKVGPTKVFTNHASITDANDPDAVPAFETSAGIPGKKTGRKAKPVVVNRYALENFNSSVSPAVIKNQLEVANVAALFAKRAVRPDEIAALRRRMFDVVSEATEEVAEVLMGRKEWNPVQVRLFSILVEKTIHKPISPKLDSPQKIEDMTVEELEAIARGKMKEEAVDVIVKDGKKLEAQELASEERATKKVLRNSDLAKIASIGDATDEFIKAHTEKQAVSKKKSSKVTTSRSQTSPKEPGETVEA